MRAARSFGGRRLAARLAGPAALAFAAALAAQAGLPRVLPAAPASAPDFRATTLEGRPIELSKLLERGPVLIDFWSTWCKPCLHSLPEIEAIHRDFSARGLTVLGVSIDGPRNFSKVRPFAARMGLTYPIVLDEDGSLQQRFQVRAVPTALVVDTTGTIAHTLQGFRPGEGRTLREAVEAVLPPRTEEAVPSP